MSDSKITLSQRSQTPIGQDPIKLAGKRFHFIGIGGIGMSGLAKLLRKHNAVVTGSDQTCGPAVRNLLETGTTIHIGHDRENVHPDTEVVVISAAVKQDNPELKLARKKGLPIYKYAEMLGALMNFYEGIAVAGTHGKSTTAGWLIYSLSRLGLNPNFIIGANISQLGNSSGTAQSNFFVAEACEFDRSFLNLNPKISTILNIEQDHLDYYENINQIIEAFSQFAHNIAPSGTVIANAEDPNVRRLLNGLDPQINRSTFGFNPDCGFCARNIQLVDGSYTFDVYRKGELLAPAKLSLPGRHNINNALAVIATADAAGIDPAKVIGVLNEFTGLDRRLMLKAKIKNVTILDDYAHHPTEIKASLKAIRQKYNPKKLWCVFQPHQYSRTRFLLDDFAQSFTLADMTVVPDIYFVRDTLESKQEINSEILVDRIAASGARAIHIDGFESISDYLKEKVSDNDVVVTMGAGDIWKVADEYIHWLRENR